MSNLMHKEETRVVIIHGYRSHPRDCWFPWLKKELIKQGFHVELPALPNPTKPKLKSWIKTIKKSVGKDLENTVLIGHSLGCGAILRYIETLGSNEKVKGVIFVAGRVMKVNRRGAINSFFEKGFPWNKLKRRVKKIVGIYSSNDPFVSTENGKIIKNKLHAKLFLLDHYGHFSRGDKVFRIPIVLRETLRIAE